MPDGETQSSSLSLNQKSPRNGFEIAVHICILYSIIAHELRSFKKKIIHNLYSMFSANGINPIARREVHFVNAAI